MEEKNRSLLVMAIAVTVIAAIFVSFGLPALTNQIPVVTLADISQTPPPGPGQEILPVEVDPDTVRDVVAALSRPENYARTLTVTLSWGENGSATRQVKTWAAEDRVKTEISGASSVQHRLVSGGTLFLWYDGDKDWKELPADSRTADLAQRIPTYDDVSELGPDRILRADYELRNGKGCVFVEAEDPDWGTMDRYWIEASTGLLAAFETEENGRTVYAVEETAFSAPFSDGSVFLLPDGSAPPSVREEAGTPDQE